MEIDRQARRVDTDLGIPRAIMVPVLRAVAFATDRGTLPSTCAAPDATSMVVERPSAPAEAPAPQPAPSSAPPPAPEPSPAPPAPPTGLGGWLIVWPPVVVVLALWLGWVATLGVARLVSVLSEAAHMVRIGLVVLPLAIAAMAALSVVVLWLHVRRSKRTRLAYGLWLVALAGLPFVADGTRLTTMSGDIMRIPWWLLYPPLGVAVVGLAYFLLSRRVRNTFVR